MKYDQAASDAAATGVGCLVLLLAGVIGAGVIAAAAYWVAH